MKTLIFKANKSKRGTLRQLHISRGPFLGLACGIEKDGKQKTYIVLFLCFQIELEITKYSL